MNHYCTYFDVSFLPQGLALWHSLQRHDPGCGLSVLALDGETATVLQALGDPGLRVTLLADLLAADPELAAVRASRSRTEFIFTLTPCWVRHLLLPREKGALAYVDADMRFFSDAAAAWRELGDGSVLIVPHRYPPWHDDSDRYGRFNVGWLVFRRDDTARACVEWWRKCCLESCALTEDGEHFGDQKYLDTWRARFGTGVRVAVHPGVNLSPWNWARHRCMIDDRGQVEVDGQPLVLFHFAQFRWIGGRWWDSGQLEYGVMPRRLRSAVYGPYRAALDEAIRRVRDVRPDFTPAPKGWRATLGPWHLAALRLFWGQCWRETPGGMRAFRCGPGRFSGRFMGAYRRWQRR